MVRPSKAPNQEKAPVVLRRLFDEHKTTLRAVSARTREVDETGKGIDYTYISGLVNGREVPSPRALELLAGVFGLAPEFFIEYRILKLRGELDLRTNGSDAAIERYLTVTGEGTR